jgi:hypothetical protein
MPVTYQEYLEDPHAFDPVQRRISRLRDCRLEPLKTVGRLLESAGIPLWNSYAEATTPRFRLVNARERPFDPIILNGSCRQLPILIAGYRI